MAKKIQTCLLVVWPSEGQQNHIFSHHDVPLMVDPVEIQRDNLFSAFCDAKTRMTQMLITESTHRAERQCFSLNTYAIIGGLS